MQTISEPRVPGVEAAVSAARAQVGLYIRATLAIFGAAGVLAGGVWAILSFV